MKIDSPELTKKTKGPRGDPMWLRLPDSLDAQVRKLAEQSGRTLTDTMVRLLAAGLEADRVSK